MSGAGRDISPALRKHTVWAQVEDSPPCSTPAPFDHLYQKTQIDSTVTKNGNCEDRRAREGSLPKEGMSCGGRMRLNAEFQD